MAVDVETSVTSEPNLRNPDHELVMACAIGSEGQLTWVSSSWETITGIPTPKLTGRRLTDLVHPEDSDEVSRHLSGPRSGENVRQFRARVTTVHGDQVPLQWTVSSAGGNQFAHAVGAGPAHHKAPSTLAVDPLEQWEIMRHCMTNALVAISPTGTIRFVNEAALTMLEFDEGELEGRKVDQLWPPDQATLWRVDLDRFRGLGATRRTMTKRETTVLTKSGRSIPVHLTVTTHQRRGVVTYALLMRDITTELFARQALTAANHRFEFCFTRNLNPMCLGDFQGHVLEANDLFLEATGFSRSELITQGWMSLIHPDDFELVQRDLVTINSDAGANTTRVVRMCGRDGSLGWIDVSLGLIMTGVDSLPTPVVMLSDVTRRENTLRVLEETQSRLKNAFERSLVGQVVLDLEGRIVVANPALARMLGCSVEGLPGTSVDTFLHPDDLTGARDAANRLRTRQVAGWRGEIRIVDRDGRPLWVLVLASAAFDENGRPSQILAQVEDISAQRQLLAAITRSNTDLQRFTHLASHDLQAPLRTIRGYTELLVDSLDKSQLTDDQITLADKIEEGVTDMQTLIGDLLTVCRVDLDQSLVEPTNASEAFQLALARLDADIERTGASVRCLAGCDVTVLARSGQLAVVLQNLIQNAITHRRPDTLPVVTVSGRTVGHHSELRVTDNGPGIEPGLRQRVFDMFAKGSETGGTGVGLALVKRIVENLGGEITIEDANPGTAVVIVLPSGSGVEPAEQAG